ncbi:hypothetical protein CANINC_002025 [Pichia inconspicua]|uniref:Protein transport protein SEC24 n=1 Tax=Pichia inconspicua TaxID=52247 RepID=A0A4T0X287_9ASCO|nr:hypothetical protein CANINC_002025 [[Candida] inconspicua]
MSNRRRAYPQPAYNPAAAAAADPMASGGFSGATPIMGGTTTPALSGGVPLATIPQATSIGGTPVMDNLASGFNNMAINDNHHQPVYPQPSYLGTQNQQQIPQQQVPQQQIPQQQPVYPSYQSSPYSGPNVSSPVANGMPMGSGGIGGGIGQQNGMIQMNQLYGTDLLKDLPPPIIDLKFPPPPINLPETASCTQSEEANASSEYIRSTLNVVPNSNSLLKKTKLPFAVVLRPYNSLTDEESPIPVISDGLICRCRRCRSYINPFVEIRPDNNRWKCNFCALLNDIPSGLRDSSMFNRYELNYGINEFIATPEYMVRAPQSLNLVFLLDVSKNSIKNGLLEISIKTILESLDRIPNDQGRANICFIGVDNKLSFFTIPQDNEINKEISMLVVSNDDNNDDDIIIPSPDDLIVNLKQCRNNIEKLLNNLSSYFITNQSLDFNLSMALKSGHSLLNKIGGKMITITSTLPNIGKGKLIVRDESSVSGKSKEASTLLTSNNSFYKSFAIDCNKSQITCDMFLCSSSYQDVATLSNLAKFTAGQTHFYPAWNASSFEDINKFSKEFSNYLSMESAFEAVMRLRCSDGIKGISFYGNFFSRSSDLLSFPSFPRDQSYLIELSIDNDIKRNIVYFQTAVLHTSCHGDRRIRVITLALPVSSNIQDIYASADQLSITKYFAHLAIDKVLNNSLENARDYLNKILIEILTVYKKEIVAGNVGSSSPLQISTNLRMLPLLIQSLIKNIAFRSGIVPSDHRSAAINKINTLPLNELIEFIYPSIYSLHDMDDECGLPFEGEDNYDEIIPKIHGEIILPENINASFTMLQKYGLYLIQTNNELFLYVGGDAVEQLLIDVFGVNNTSELLIGKHELPILDNEFSIRVRNIINKVRESRGSIRYENLYIVVGPSSNERALDSNLNTRDLMALRMWCMSHLVEDRTGDVLGYKEFLSQLKDKISN